MNKILWALPLCLLLLAGCKHKETQAQDAAADTTTYAFGLDTAANTVRTRYTLRGYRREMSDGFGEYLRDLPLKPYGYRTHTYTGEVKEPNVASGVLDIDVTENQQCADAAIRLWAEYLYKTRQYGKIAFHFTNGFMCSYEKWARGYRVGVNAAQTRTWWIAPRAQSAPDYSYRTFRAYLEQVFLYCGTRSLADYDMVPLTNTSRAADAPTVGDVLLDGGHCCIILDQVGPKFLLAQSFIPAQDIEIIYTQGHNLWYQYPECGEAYPTIEWTFVGRPLRHGITGPIFWRWRGRKVRASAEIHYN